jgi:hypothetical protein
LVEHNVPMVVVVPHGGVNGEVVVAVEVWREDGAPMLDL